MTTLSKPTILMTHKLPEDWILSIIDHCTILSGPQDAIEFSPKLKESLPDAVGLLSLLTIPIDVRILELAPNLRVVSNMAVGTDNIDIEACTRRRIPVGNTPGVLTESTADLTMALLLSAARNLPAASRDAREGRWKTWLPDGWLGKELNGSILGIIGMGKIGQAVARRAMGFGMKIIYADPDDKNIPTAARYTMEELLSQSDFISLHAPLTRSTRRMIDSTAFALMKPTSILVNAARGPLVETEALITALKNHKIAAAALDVTDPEPLPQSHSLYSLPNCLIVPHIGSATHETRRLMAELACQNLLAGIKGERLPNCVNPEVYDQN